MAKGEAQDRKTRENAEKIKDFILFKKEDFTFIELHDLIKENLGIDDVYFIDEQLSDLCGRREVFAYDYYSSRLMNPLPPIIHDYDMED